MFRVYLGMRNMWIRKRCLDLAYLYCAVVLSEKIMYLKILFLIIEIRVLLGLISLNDFI